MVMRGNADLEVFRARSICLMFKYSTPRDKDGFLPNGGLLNVVLLLTNLPVNPVLVVFTAWLLSWVLHDNLA